MAEKELPETVDGGNGDEVRTQAVDEYLEEIGVYGDGSDVEVVTVEYVGHGQYNDSFKRHGQKQDVPVTEAQELLGVSGEDGPLFKRV